MPETPAGDAAAIIAAARAGVEPYKINDRYLLTPSSNGRTELVDLDQYAPTPRRVRGEAYVNDVASFVNYWTKYAVAASEVWASQQAKEIVGVLDAPDGRALPDWAQHTVKLICETDPNWTLWVASSGAWMNQTDFAEMIEDRLNDFVEPVGATMLELAQSFQATQKVSFESSQLLTSGEHTLQYKDNIDAKAGRGGKIQIPAEFKIGVRPFRRSEPYRVTARLRYRIREGNLLLGYKLNQTDDVVRSAFDDIAGQIRDELDVPVLDGKPGYRN